VVPVLVLVTLYISHSVERVILLIFPALALLLVTVGASLAVSALFVFFRDLPYIYELVVFICWMTSPIFYPEDIVPEKLRPWVELNPIAAITNDIRQIAFSQGHVHLHQLAITVLIALVTAVVGAIVFLVLQKHAMDLL
jgi:lipopolysaccharide transport system permease protein